MLKTLMLKRKIDDAKQKLEVLRTAKADLEKREAELEGAIAEANTDEEKAVVDAEIAKHEEESTTNAQETERIESEINALEAELAEAEARQADTTGSQPEDVPAEPTVSRKVEVNTMHKRIADMTMEQRAAFVAREDVKAFVENMRSIMKGEKRSVTGTEYLIPDIVVGLLTEAIKDGSKLYKHVNVQKVSGKARQTIMGLIPEAVWTEQCGKLNELNFSFGQIEVDGFKVGGFVAVCNAILEDSDIDLVNAIVTGLGQSIGRTLDKAIVFGTDVKMPKGIFTSLPSDNKVSIAASVKGADFFAKFVEDAALADSKYASNGMFWVANTKTKAAIVAKSLSINAAGAVVAGANSTMPVVGGDIETLEFMPDNVVIGGYGELYLLAERAGAAIKSSEECNFVEDQTVFKGTARYDGEAVIPAAFVAIGIEGTTPSASGITFAPDTANPVSDDQAAG